LETITIILLLLLAVVLSSLISRMLPLPIPRPLVQIGFGVVIGLVTHLRVVLDPEIFFLLFVPPLLFLDGWRIPNEDLLKNRTVILQLALGLVAFTVVGIGYFVSWIIPAIPLAVALALAAVISPTDSIAVSAISSRAPIPKRLMRILEGESLLNDASGLVCLRFAILAALTGTFSLYDAALNFLWMALGGIAIGAGITWLTARAKEWATQRLGEDSGSQILISLLIPFAAYLLAEHLHCSGILAAVAAGITMSYVETSGQALATTRMRRHSVWETVRFAANGIVFVLLGEQLPAILETAPATVQSAGHQSPWWLLIYVAVIYIGLGLLRCLWIWASLQLPPFRTHLQSVDSARPNWRLVAIATLAGVRGTITLAGVLTLPIALRDNTPFPARDLAISLAMGVIILSLIVASIGLPLLLRGLKLPATAAAENQEEDRARIAAAEAAITEVERVRAELGDTRTDAHTAAATVLTELYRSRIHARSQSGEAAALTRHNEAIERTMRIAAVKVERTTIFQLLQTHQIGSETARKLVNELDLLEARYEC